MTQELIYTSAPKGLKPGSRGFCTVASSTGMARPLVERLESLSGYRHLYAPGDPKAALNPIAWSHLRLAIGGANYHVLARIGDAGLDYSGRTNKIAHHVVCSPKDLNSAGPAWCLAQPGWMTADWRGEPRILTTERSLPATDIAPSRCSSWARIAGDAGWAGELAQTAYDQRPALIIYPLGVDVLPLLVEAQQLIPPSMRWKVSFSTYMMKLPPGIDCQWQCHSAESSDLTTLRRTPNALILDLSTSLGPAPDSPASFAAREGRAIPAPSGRAALHASRKPPSGGLSFEDADDDDWHALPMPESDNELRQPGPPRVAPPSLAQASTRPKKAAASDRPSRTAWIVLGGSLIALLGAMGAYLASRPFLAEHQLTQQQTQPAPRETKPEHRTESPKQPAKPVEPSVTADNSSATQQGGTREHAPDRESTNAPPPDETPAASDAPAEKRPGSTETTAEAPHTSPPGGAAMPIEGVTTNNSLATPAPQAPVTEGVPDQAKANNWVYTIDYDGLWPKQMNQTSSTHMSSNAPDIEIAHGDTTGPIRLDILQGSLISKRIKTELYNSLDGDARQITFRAINAWPPLDPAIQKETENDVIGTLQVRDGVLLFTPGTNLPRIRQAPSLIKELEAAVVTISKGGNDHFSIPLWGDVRHYPKYDFERSTELPTNRSPLLLSEDTTETIRKSLRASLFVEGLLQEAFEPDTEANPGQNRFVWEATAIAESKPTFQEIKPHDVTINMTWTDTGILFDRHWIIRPNHPEQFLSKMQEYKNNRGKLAGEVEAMKDRVAQDAIKTTAEFRKHKRELIRSICDDFGPRAELAFELFYNRLEPGNSQHAFYFHVSVVREIGGQHFEVLRIGDKAPLLSNSLRSTTP